MYVLAVIGQKGGNGKTTLSLGLAVQASRLGKTVAIVDLDPQTSAANWSDRRTTENPTVVSCQVSRLQQVLGTAESNGVDLVVIDTPGKSTDALIAASKAANFALMPIQPQLFDIETLPNLKDVLTLAGHPKSAVVVNRAPIQGKRHLETQDAVLAQGMTICPFVIHARAAHGDAGNVGQTAAEYDPSGKAAEEMAALYSYIAIALEEKTNEKAKRTR